MPCRRSGPAVPPRRSPHGERGLKSDFQCFLAGGYLSLPPRGAWIEISVEPETGGQQCRRSPHGERGLKYLHPVKVRNGGVAPPTGSVD